ncbi:MAG: LamG domain-containing protein, partial [Chloroflexia bacterium]|nr:LamG domain-containing protein [Chloroflexia bacterium]
CSTFNDELLSTTIISDREWHHYVCVVSGNQRRLYIDGALDGSRTAAVPNYAQNATLYVGRRMDVARAFEGTIDELGIYSFAINAGQVGQLYALDPNMAIASVGASFDDVVIAESNGVFSYCINQTCPQVYYPDVYYPDEFCPQHVPCN